jgi:hypothetical protein
LNQQFITLGNNKNTSHKTQNNSNVAIANPDYTLLNTNQTLRVGQNFRINSTTDQDIQYTTANVTLVPLAPLPPNTKLSDIDPETDIIQQTPLIALGSYQGNIRTFVMPQVAHPRYYLLDVSLNYSSQGTIAVYSTIVRIVA